MYIAPIRKRRSTYISAVHTASGPTCSYSLSLHEHNISDTPSSPSVFAAAYYPSSFTQHIFFRGAIGRAIDFKRHDCTQVRKSLGMGLDQAFALLYNGATKAARAEDKARGSPVFQPQARRCKPSLRPKSDSFSDLFGWASVTCRYCGTDLMRTVVILEERILGYHGKAL